MIEIIISKKAKEYIEKKKLNDLLIEISFFAQQCVQVYEPKIVLISPEDIKIYQDNEKVIVNGLNIYFSNQFIETFKKQNKIHINLQKFPKKLIIKNIDPIIINVCKLDK